jgi:hypothetical protein
MMVFLLMKFLIVIMKRSIICRSGIDDVVPTPTLPVKVLIPVIDKLVSFRVFVANVKPVMEL